MRLDERHEKALASLEAEEFDAAGELLERLNKDASWLVKNDLALCRYMQGDLEAAVELFDRILQQEPGNGFAIINRYYAAEADKVRGLPAPDPISKIEEIKGDGPEDPRVTVVMPTFNRPELIRESIESILSQTMLKWELIVVNDGGGIEVEKTMDEYLHDHRVRYVRAEHGGLSSARNVGMALARGEYITQLDDDDVYYPEHLETVSTAFYKNPDARVVYTDFYRAYQEERGGEWVTTRRVLDYANEFSRELMKTSTIAPVCNVTQHRETLDTVGYYNEHVLRAMDWEYFIRLSKKHEFVHIKEVTGEFRQKSDRSQMTRSFTIPRNYYRNLVSYLHGFFPLTGARFAPSKQGSGDRLKTALERLLAGDEDNFFLKRLELRKLINEPYYALFHTLGKRLADEGHRQEARRAFRAAAEIRPYEIKSWLKWIKP